MTSPHEEGSPDAKIIFLAEAPSRVEMRLGRPLVGPSGDVFNQCLHTAGLIRRECYILNVWPFQVTKDKHSGHIYYEGDLLWHSRNGFTDKGLEYAATTLNKIDRSSANLIVTLGQQAMELALGDKRPVMKWRGSVVWGERVDRKVIPTIHPAATLHGTYLWRYLIIADMEKARTEMDSPLLQLPDRRLLIEPSHSDILEYLGLAGKEHHRVATDIEVINHQVSCFSICYHPTEAMTIHLADESGKPYWSEEQEMAIWLAYAKVMGNPDVEKINQNIIGFDAPFLLQQNNIITRGFLGDTMIAQHIMYPDFPKGLDFITSIHTKEPYYKDEGKMWKGLGGDIEQFWRYCAKDAAVALEAWDKLQDEMTANGYWPTYRMTARLASPLQYMTVRGFRVDMDRLEETKQRVDAGLARKEAELEECAEWNFSPTSPKQCQQYFYGTKGIQPYKGAKGTITTDDKAMARIFRRFDLKEAKLVQEIRALKKLKGTYLEVAFDKDNRLRCSWNPRGTWTGRLSSSQTVFGTGMNMQNLHPEFKNFLVADEEELT